MENNPTEKKLTFVEWYANKIGGDKEITGAGLIVYIKNVIKHGIHDGKCVGKKRGCVLCALEQRLTEYHKYFKQNSK